MQRNAWLGREVRRTDVVNAELVGRWCATLDRLPALDGLAPQGLHWCLCLPDAPTAQLGEDGHPRRDATSDSFLPPVPLPRRMWASSSVKFLRPLPIGAAIERVSRIGSITPKGGSSGPLVFLEVEHVTTSDGDVCVREVQSIVYREASPPGAPHVPPPAVPEAFDLERWDATRTLTPSEPQLFRYSALTFNSHRIHYDRPYAIDHEGYRGLVVHGPLTATLLIELARRELGEQSLTTFAFRGLSPAICGEPLHLALRRSNEGYDLAAYASDGRAVMRATASART